MVNSAFAESLLIVISDIGIRDEMYSEFWIIFAVVTFTLLK